MNSQKFEVSRRKLKFWRNKAKELFHKLKVISRKEYRTGYKEDRLGFAECFSKNLQRFVDEGLAFSVTIHGLLKGKKEKVTIDTAIHDVLRRQN